MNKSNKMKRYSQMKMRSYQHLRKRGIEPTVFHYSNGVYMGGFKGLQKDGKGIFLQDGGPSVLSSFQQDLLHGHNIFFQNHCFLSANYKKNNIITAVYRTDGFLLYLAYNNMNKLQGRCILINYISRIITYVQYNNGEIIKKYQQKSKSIIQNIFDKNQLGQLIDQNHCNALKYKTQQFQSIKCDKIGNTFNCGFVENGCSNGLGFKAIIRGDKGGCNIENNCNEDDFLIKIVERGYYMNSKLQGLGQRWFSNGNYYTGEFKNDEFDGRGILRNKVKQNWISGRFGKGNLVKLIQYNRQKQNNQLTKAIQQLHQNHKHWINKTIFFIQFSLFDQIVNFILSYKLTQTKKHYIAQQQFLENVQSSFIGDIKQKQSNQMSQIMHKKTIHNFVVENSNSKYQLFGNLKQSNLKTRNSFCRSKSRKNRIFQNSKSKSRNQSKSISQIKINKRRRSPIFTPNDPNISMTERRQNINGNNWNQIGKSQMYYNQTEPKPFRNTSFKSSETSPKLSKQSQSKPKTSKRKNSRTKIFQQQVNNSAQKFKYI